MAKKKKNSNVTLNDILKTVSQAHKLEAPDFRVKHWLSTGLTPLDAAMSWDGLGFPLGRMVTLKGGEGTGKTAFALNMCKQAIDEGGSAYYILGEPDLADDLAERRIHIDIDDDSFQTCFPDTLEQALGILESILVKARNTTVPLMIVVDTINGLQAAANMAHAIEDQKIQTGLPPRTIAQFFRRPAYKKILGSKIGLLMLQQTYTKMSFTSWGGGSGLYATGGRALKFYAGIRLESSAGSKFKSPRSKTVGPDVGKDHNFKVVKTKYGPDTSEVTIPWYYRTGWDEAEACVEWLVKHKVGLIKSGSYYKFADKKYYKSKWVTLAREKPKLLARFQDLILKNCWAGY